MVKKTKFTRVRSDIVFKDFNICYNFALKSMPRKWKGQGH